MSNLSNKGRTKFAKALTVLTSVTTMLSMSGVMYLAPVASAVAPADYGLKEGDVVSAAGSDDPDVYIVNELGYKRLFLNPAIFNFYGHLGGFAAVKNVSAATRDAFGTSGLFRNCETNDPKVYGVETTGEDVGMLHWVNTPGSQAVLDDANFFKKVFCVNNNEFNWYPKGSDYTSVNQVPNYSRGTTVSTGPLSVGLDSSNPVAGTLVETQALADLAHFNVSGSGVVTNVEFKRLGVSSDTTLSAVYLFVNGARVSDAGNVSSGMVTFTNGGGLFSAPAVVSVKANVAASTAGQTAGVQMTKVNTSVVSASGNVHTIAAVPGTFAAVALSAPTGPGDFDPGVDIVVWKSSFTVSSEDVYFKRLTLREIGSVNNTDVVNLRLFVDGSQVATSAGLTTDGYATFLMNQRMLQGTRVVKVIADVISGSTRTMQFQLKGAYDVDVMDEALGVNVIPSGSITATPAASTVGAPSITVIKATDSPSANVVNDAKNVKLAKYTMTGYGEAVKIETLAFKSTFVNTTGGGTIDGLDNGRVMINGQQYGSTTDILLANTDFTVNYTLQPGTPVTVEVYADIQDSTGDQIDNTDTVKVTWEAGDNGHGQGVVSAATVDVPGTNTVGAIADVDANTITIATGSMTVGKYTGYANQSIVPPISGVKFGHFTLTAASSEDVAINTVDITGATVVDAGDDWDEADITSMYLKFWNDAGSLVYPSAIKSTVSTSASNSYSVNFTVPKNKVYQVEVWGNVSSTDAAALDSFALEFDIAGTTTDSSTTVNVTRVTGQTVAAQTGVLTVANGSLPVARFINGGATSNTYQFTLTPTYDNFTVEEIYVDIPASPTASQSGAISNVFLKDGSMTLATGTLTSTGSVSFTGLNLLLPQSGGTKTLSVDVQFSNVGVSLNDTGGSVTVRLDGLKYSSGSGTTTTTTGLSTTTYTGNAFVNVKGYPTFTNSALSTTVLNGGSMTLFKTVVSATGGQIAWNDITFTVASTSVLGTFAN